MYFVQNIETLNNPELEIFWKKNNEDEFPPVYCHIPLSIGAVIFDDKYELVKTGRIGGKAVDPEEDKIRKWADAAGKSSTIVSFNGRTFDLPILALRAFHYGIPLPWYYEANFRYRYQTNAHIDMMDYLSGYGAIRPVRFSVYCALMGLPGNDNDTNIVASWYADKGYESIEHYCIEHVWQKAFMFLRLEYIRTKLSLEDYQEKTKKIFDRLSTEYATKHKTFFEKVDQQKLLLI